MNILKVICQKLLNPIQRWWERHHKFFEDYWGIFQLSLASSRDPFVSELSLFSSVLRDQSGLQFLLPKFPSEEFWDMFDDSLSYQFFLKKTEILLSLRTQCHIHIWSVRDIECSHIKRSQFSYFLFPQVWILFLWQIMIPPKCIHSCPSSSSVLDDNKAARNHKQCDSDRNWIKSALFNNFKYTLWL